MADAQAETPRNHPIKRGDPIQEAPSAAHGTPGKKPPCWRFTFSDSVRDPQRDPQVVVLRELDADGLAQANRLAGDDKRRSADEAIKLSLWEVDGRRVNHGEAEADFLWARWSSKVRVQLGLAWAKIHTTSDAEDKGFLDSMEPA